MFAQICLCTVLAVPNLVEDRAQLAEDARLQLSDHKQSVVVGTFLGMAERFPQRFVQRFLVRTTADIQAEIELAPTGLVTRNSQPARLADLQPGDRVVVQMMTPVTPMAARVDATGP